MNREYSPDYPEQPDDATYPNEPGYSPELTLVEESNLVDVLKYSQDDLERFKEEAVMEENEKLMNAEQEFLMGKNELQKWFESEVRLIRRNADEQIREIEKEMNLARRESASETLRLQEEIEMKNVNIHNITQETSLLRQEIDRLKHEVLEKHNRAHEQMDTYTLKRLEHDQYKREYDMASRDYEAVTSSFAELHAQYNELKRVSEHIQGIEDGLLRELKSQEHNLHIWNSRYKQLKEQTDSEIAKANSIFESMLTSHEHDKATADNEKKAIDIQISSATEALELKKQQNTELNNICQELMGAFNT